MYDCCHSISKTTTYAKWTKRPINTHHVIQEGSDNSSNNNSRCPEMFYKKGVLQKFHKNHWKILIPDSLS